VAHSQPQGPASQLPIAKGQPLAGLALGGALWPLLLVVFSCGLLPIGPLVRRYKVAAAPGAMALGC